MKSLPSRVASAVIAILVIGLTYFFTGTKGLVPLSFIICAIGCFEFARMMIVPLKVSKSLIWVFMVISLSSLLIATLYADQYFWGLLLFVLYFCFFVLWSMHKTHALQQVYSVIQTGVLGIFYSAILPSFAIKLLRLENGGTWFLFLLVVVFSGDIFAYFGGITMGRTKIMPSISPNKTLAGAVAGLAGSVLAGALFAKFFLGEINLIRLVIYILISALLAQTGDLFESLLKRIAQVKDSGRIMPGHGGVLDRLDGIYFAAPLIYALAEFAK